MNAAERLAELFVTPSAERSATRTEAAAVGVGGCLLLAAPVPWPALAGVRVCVLGGERTGACFARAFAARLARLPGGRCAVLGVPASEAAKGDAAARRPVGSRGSAVPGPRRVAHDLLSGGHPASARGRIVEVSLPSDPAAIGEALADIRRRAAGVPTLTLLPGPRCSALDPVVAEQDLVLVVVTPDAPVGLSALAVAEVLQTAPAAIVRVVELRRRLGAAARRAAVKDALGALR